jgi:hypothetical protein
MKSIAITAAVTIAIIAIAHRVPAARKLLTGVA